MRKYLKGKGCMSGLTALFGILLALIVLLNMAFRVVLVDGVSMQPTLTDGDWILVCRVAEPKRGDVIVTNRDNTQDARLIKRLIAMPGDTVDINFSTGEVTVNGETLNETYLAEKTHTAGDVTFPLTVPAGQVFLLGDNRANSMDSRYTEIGCVPQDDVIGPVIFVLLHGGTSAEA